MPLYDWHYILMEKDEYYYLTRARPEQILERRSWVTGFVQISELFSIARTLCRNCCF